MYKIFAQTLFLGKQYFDLKECSSTNTRALELAQEQGLQHGAVIRAHRQWDGRGQRGNTWETEAGLNLTFSIYLKPSLAAAAQFYLSITTALALQQTAQFFLPHHEVTVKWPNDLYIGKKKVGGILIENNLENNVISQSIVGIGLNVNQHSFPVENAASLASLLGHDLDQDFVLQKLAEFYEYWYGVLEQKNYELLAETYYDHLLGYNQERLFLKGEKYFKGIIRGVSPFGQLIMEENGQRISYDIKEISFVI
ncbi:MAG: biotin--[acetyl-CoA-carboxylase] ligase [Cytophagales bacterium]|nr:biotin--[acetyl-CoA-carboxylase] ligase [Cytophagales bacterium]